MSPLTQLPLAQVVAEAKAGFACGEEDPHGVFQIRMNNLTRRGQLDLRKKRRVPANHKALGANMLEPGDILFNATNSLELVGKTAIFPEMDEVAVFSNHFLRLRTRRDILVPEYLTYWLQAQFEAGVFRSMCRQWVNQATLSRDSLLSLKIPLPSIDEQHRLSHILETADVLRANRRIAIALLDSLAQSLFIRMFGDVARNDRAWEESIKLGDVADIGSGITKGRSTSTALLRTVPYMTVLNVQERRLDLSVVKTIEATETEIRRYQLVENDLLLTEGGDSDKLGRGTLWRGEIPECIHQNHIFRVRIRGGSGVEPIFLNWLVASERGRRYFLSSAKQTTGIASINASQLKNFPLLVPPLTLQQDFARRLSELEQHKTLQLAHLAELDALFASLQHRAFRGEL